MSFTNGHTGKASEIAFKARTVLVKSFDSPRAPLQEIPKNSLDRITLADGVVLTAGEIKQRQSPPDQIALFVKQEALRVAADDGSPRPVAYEWSNFLDKSMTLTSVFSDTSYTVLTFVRRQAGGSRFILSSATYLYNRQDVREAYRIVRADKFDLDVPVTIPAAVDSIQYSLYFERVRPGLDTINFKSLPIAAGLIGGPVGGYMITGIELDQSTRLGMAGKTDLPVMAFGKSRNCISCGGVAAVRCPNCLGERTILITEQRQVRERNRFVYRPITERVTCPVCQGNGNFRCPNRPNHTDAP
ncbi:hypothetical protein GCM10028825_32010 [Spirosoma agri]